MIHFQRT